jgi:hypothetical protein
MNDDRMDATGGQGDAVTSDHHRRRLPHAVPALGLAALTTLAAPAVAHADSALSFVHAVPGAGKATLQAGSTRVGEEGFAGVSAYRNVGSGTTKLTLKSPDGKTLATKTVKLADGTRYAVVALLDGMKPVLEAYPDAKPKAGVAKLRVVHAVPELGSPEIWVDGKKVMDKLDYRAASPYLTVKPGTHTYSAHKPNDGALLSGKLDLKAGTVSTGFVVGSRGEKIRVVPALDDQTTAAPAKKQKAKAKKTTPAAPSGASTYTVRAGDSLWAIARHDLGGNAGNAATSRRVVQIWNANSKTIGTGNPNLIRPGTRLHL